MKVRLEKIDLVLIGLGALGLVLHLWLYEGLYPSASIKMDYSREQIRQIGNRIVKELGYDLASYEQLLDFRKDGEQIRYLESAFGTDEANELMRKEIPAYYWQIKWMKPTKLERIIIGTRKEEEIQKTVSATVLGEFRLRLDTHGKLVSFATGLREEMLDTELSAPKALEIATKFLQKYLGADFVNYEFTGIDSIKRKNSSDFSLQWKRTKPLHGEEVTVKIDLHGKRIAKFEKILIPPNVPQVSKIIRAIPTVFLFIVYLVLFLIVLVRKLRVDAVSLQSGLPIGIVVGASAVLTTIVLSVYQKSILEVIVSVIFVGPVVGFLLMFVLAVSDSLAREVWPEKLLTFDALQKGRVLHRRFSCSIFRGLSLAFISLGLTTLVLKLGSRVLHLYFTSGDYLVNHVTSGLPFLYVLGRGFAISAFAEFIFRLFTLSFLRKVLHSAFWIVFLGALIWPFSFLGAGVPMVSPHGLQLLCGFLIGLLFGYFFFRFDLVTVLVAGTALPIIREAYLLMNFGQSFFANNGIALLGAVGVLFLVAVIGYTREVGEEELLQYQPSYVNRIAERERLQRELEIARRVQMSFLPKGKPTIEGLDIATICIPATEVGGDYYDFIDLGEGKLGVVIGDVSGKGISAAFYMTLTKGFLKAQATETLSPKEILIKINRLFYANVARGPFISMIYGIWDVHRKNFTFARAGHNPVIVWHATQGTSRVLCPPGIALGLERGKIFSAVIEEQQIRFDRGDIFLLYTDGFTEAKDKRNHEFGEERLLEIVTENKNKRAEELLEVIKDRVYDFTNKTPQFDDMTMVVVRIV